MQLKRIAIITARGGSKRIPRKNIKLFLGEPIIAYPIKAALRSGLFDVVMVSTDDDEIAGIAKLYGAEVPFLRSPKNSDDFSGTVDVIVEVLDQYKVRNIFFTYACCIYPTAPMLQPDDLVASFQMMEEKNFATVFPVVGFSYQILRALDVDPCGRISMRWPENMSKRSQDLPPAYHDAGQFYWITTKNFMNEKKIFSDNSGAFVLDELKVQDIDTLTDWQIAEMKYRLLSTVKAEENKPLDQG